MIRLSASQLGGICREAGFADRHVVTAVACALGASGGDPAYEHAIWPGPSAVYKGLWGVDLCEHHYLIGEPLANPYRAATAAYDLTQDHQGFGWCAAFRAQSHLAYMDQAAIGVTMVPRPDPEHVPTSAPGRIVAAQRTAERLRAAVLPAVNISRRR